MNKNLCLDIHVSVSVLIVLCFNRQMRTRYTQSSVLCVIHMLEDISCHLLVFYMIL